MLDVAGISGFALAGGRTAAAKTGTIPARRDPREQRDAWTVGYTPSLSAAVWVGTDKSDPIRTRRAAVYGAMLPGSIWQAFMNAALRGTGEQFSPFDPMGTPLGRRRRTSSDESDDDRLRRREVRRRGQGRRRLRPQQRRLGPRIRRLERLRQLERLGQPQRLRKRLEQRLERRGTTSTTTTVFEEPRSTFPAPSSTPRCCGRRDSSPGRRRG